MRGKRFFIEREQLIDMIYEQKGHITYVADALHVSYRALKEFIEIEHPDINDIIKKALDDGWTSRLDRKERVVEDIAKMVKEAPGAALAAAKMTLYSKRGRARGWGDDNGDEESEHSLAELAEKAKSGELSQQ